MITGGEIYGVIVAMLPMYVAILLGYATVKWWRIFTPEQCTGINHFVANIGLPLLFFKFMAKNNPYTMNFRFIAADALQKVVILAALFVWLWVGKKSATLGWVITLYSLSTIPNTIVIGVPLLKAMYGDMAISLLIQIAVVQCLIWVSLLMVMFECRAATALLSEKFSDDADERNSLRVDSIRNSLRVDSINMVSLARLGSLDAEADSPSNLVIRRSVSFRSDNKSSYRKDSEDPGGSRSASSSNVGGGGHSIRVEEIIAGRSPASAFAVDDLPRGSHGLEEIVNVRGVAGPPTLNQRDGVTVCDCPNDPPAPGSSYGLEAVITNVAGGGATPPTLSQREESTGVGQKKQAPSAWVVAKLILVTVCRNLIRSPMLYGSVIGLVWSLIAFRWKLSTPKIVEGSVDMLADAAIGMAMFGLGLSVALQPKIITCSKMETMIAMVMRFLVGPIVTTATSSVLGLRGPILRVSIVQASLPQAVTCFVYSKVYENQQDILGTAVIFGTLISLPIVIIYYVILGL